MTLPFFDEKTAIAQCNALLAQGALNDALALADAALERWPSSRGLRHRRATALRRAARHREARDLLESLHLERPDSAGIAVELAATLKSLGDLDQAEHLYRHGLDLQTEHEGALAGMIEVALARGDLDLALSRSEAALVARPDSRIVRNRRATTLRRSGRIREAAALLKVLHGELPDHIGIAIEFAGALRQMGEVARAEALYSDVLAASPTNEAAQAGLIDIALGFGDTDIALARSAAALALHPESRVVRHRHARALRSAGLNAEARDLLQALHYEGPFSISVAQDLAFVLRGQGEHTKACALYATILDAAPASWPALEGLAALKEASGETAELIALLEKSATVPSAIQPDGCRSTEAIIPACCLKLIELWIKTGHTIKATDLCARLASSEAPLTEHELTQFIRLADRLGDHATLVALIEQVNERPGIRIALALTVLRLARATEQPDLAAGVARKLVERLSLQDRPQFQAEADMLLRGPFVALEGLLAVRQVNRTPREVGLLARFLLACGRNQLALRYLRLSVRRWPNALPLRLQLVSAYIANGQAADGQAWLDLQARGMEEAERDDLRLRLLIETDSLEPAIAIVERQVRTGRRPAGSDQQLRLLLALGEVEEAEQVEALARRSMAQSRSRAAHFGTSHAGALLTELRLYARARQTVTSVVDHADLVATNYHAARETLDRWRRDHAGEVPSRDGGAIPKRIVQYWNDADPPPEVAVVMRSWQSVPGWEHVLYDRQRALRWLSETFDRDHARAFALARHVAQEADFLRLCLLYHGGGIYADADDLLVGHPDSIVADGRGLVVFLEAYGAVANNLICAAPEHPVLGRAVAMAREALLRRDNDGTWLKTGPGLLTRAVAAHVGTDPEGAARDTTVCGLGTLQRYVRAHVQMPYKSGVGYWNKSTAKMKDGSVVKALLEKFGLTEGIR